MGKAKLGEKGLSRHGLTWRGEAGCDFDDDLMVFFNFPI